MGKITIMGNHIFSAGNLRLSVVCLKTATCCPNHFKGGIAPKTTFKYIMPQC